MDNETLFSVIIPTYNRAYLFSRAVKSIIEQTYTNWELIVVDDESIDNTKEVVESFNDKRIKYIYKKNNERSAARNTGIENAKGDYICFLDDDDYYLNNHLEEFYKVIEINSFPKAVIYCNTIEDIDGKLTQFPDFNVKANNNIEFVLLKIIGCPRTCISSDILAKYKFNEKIKIGEDTELWTRILKEYPLIYNNQYTVVFTSHSDRTVHISNEASFKAHLILIKKIISEDKQNYISPKIRKELLGISWFNLARHYEFKKKRLKAIFALLNSLLIKPNQKFKEKIYMILKNFINIQ